MTSDDRARAIDRAQLPPGDLRLTKVLLGRANALRRLDRLDEAARSYDDAIALFDRAGAKSIDVPTTLYNRAELQIYHRVTANIVSAPRVARPGRDRYAIRTSCVYELTRQSRP